MNFQKVKKLVLADLLQTNRQLNTSGKKLEQKNILFRLLLQNGIILISFGVLFGAILSSTPFLEFPGVFTNMLNTILIFSALQLFQFIFTLFYEEEDLSAYLALPFTTKELFTSKIISLLSSSFSFFLFPILLFVVTGSQAGFSMIFSIPIALLNTILIYGVLILGIFTFLHVLNQLEIFHKHKRIFSIIVYVALTITVFFIIFKQSYSDGAYEAVMQDQMINPLFIGFYEIFVPHLRLAGLWKLGIWGIGLVFLLWFANRNIIPQLFTDEKKTSSKKKVTKKSGTQEIEFGYKNSRVKNFINYQLRQLQDATFVMQLIFSKFYIPFVMIAPFIFGGDDFLDLTEINQTYNLWGLFILAGLVISIMLINDSSISGVIISLDQENYYYIQSMPFSFKKYLKTKFYFAFFVEWILGAVAIVFVLFYMKLSVLFSISTLFGYTIGTYVMSARYYKRDYEKLYLNWSNFSDLSKRGLNQAVRVFLIMFVIMVFTGLFIFLFVYVMTSFSDTSRNIFSILMTILPPALTYIYYIHLKNSFWKRFE